MAASDNAKIVEKIPFFHGLSPNQVRQILNAGQMSAYKQGHILAKDGDKSTEMYILLTGSLAIKSSEVELARVRAVDIVGEMGVVTNEPRCATIEVAEGASVMLISKIQFDAILRKDVDMAAKIYRNMVNSLCQKLRENNAQLAQSRSEAEREMAASAV